MSDKNKITITPAEALKGESPLVLVALLEPVAGLDRFQPAGFPEVGHVIYKAPREGDTVENVCIVDSAASMANHLESVCMRGAHDYDLVDELIGMPYLRCVTGSLEDGKDPEVVVTSLTEGHRIASTYLLDGYVPSQDGHLKVLAEESGKSGKRNKRKSDERDMNEKFESLLIKQFGIELPGRSQAHAPAAKWWDVFKTIFRYDPNALVHGVLFPKWQIKIPRVLTAHLEALGAGRVDRSGVKFDRLGKTTSGQPIFAVDDVTAREIRATFILDLAFVRSFGRQDGEETRGLTDNQKEFLVALALWKIQRLLAAPFRFRSGCHLRCKSIESAGKAAEIVVDIKKAITDAKFANKRIDVWWPREEIYKLTKVDDNERSGGGDDKDDDNEQED